MKFLDICHCHYFINYLFYRSKITLNKGGEGGGGGRKKYYDVRRKTNGNTFSGKKIFWLLSFEESILLT
jgi:hypothetical protein